MDLDGLDLPYFVYGTLRPGFGNSRIWKAINAKAQFDGECRVKDWALINTNSVIPYAIPSPGHVVWGTLIYPGFYTEDQQRLRRGLDTLEGHPEHYDRLKVEVQCPKGSDRDAWIYSPTMWVPKGILVESGDYRNWPCPVRRDTFVKT